MRQADLYIENLWVRTEESFPVIDPYRKDTIAKVSKANADHITLAIQAAKKSFDPWKRVSVYDKSTLLIKTADGIEAQKSRLAEIMSLESGKTISDSSTEVQLSADTFRFYGEEVKRLQGELIPSRNGATQIVYKVPLGVVALITPWNFPMNLAARKMAPALAAGNTVLLKPSSKTPLSTYELVKIMDEVGFPPGVISYLPGDSGVFTDVIMASDDVRKISFTGSTKVGKMLYQKSADTLKKMSLELGGNAPFIICASADIQRSVALLLAAKKRNNGQVCTSPNRVFVHRSIIDEWCEQFQKTAATLNYGDPLLSDTDLGPVIDVASETRIQDLITDTLNNGSTDLTVAGAKMDDAVPPLTILRNADSDLQIFKEEIFGPVISIFPFTSDDEVVAMANDTEYGLASYVCTQDRAEAEKIANELDYGLVGINSITLSTTETPFGGGKHSGFGRENGRYGLDDFMETKFFSWGADE